MHYKPAGKKVKRGKNHKKPDTCIRLHSWSLLNAAHVTRVSVISLNSQDVISNFCAALQKLALTFKMIAA